MRKILGKYSCVFFFFVGSFVMLAETPPPGLECCVVYENDNDPGPSPEYLACVAAEEADPGSYCNPALPIDNSVYIYVSMAVGLALASFVMIKKIKSKKTPM